MYYAITIIGDVILILTVIDMYIFMHYIYILIYAVHIEVFICTYMIILEHININANMYCMCIMYTCRYVRTSFANSC